MNSLSLRALAALALFTLAPFSCSPPPEEEEEEAIVEAPSATQVWQQKLATLTGTLQEANSLAGVTIPILNSPILEKSWGKPSIRTSPAGAYELYYSDPKRSFESLVIVGSPVALPSLETPPPIRSMDRETPQEWRTVSILGKTVRSYIEVEGGGADGEGWATEVFPLTSPSGKRGHYRLTMEFNTETAPQRFSQVGWQR